jgi:hypothetical protein
MDSGAGARRHPPRGIRAGGALSPGTGGATGRTLADDEGVRGSPAAANEAVVVRMKQRTMQSSVLAFVVGLVLALAWSVIERL